MNNYGLKRTTTNLPQDLLEEAVKITGKNITDTIVDGLLRIKRSSAYDKARALKGKINLDIDLRLSRERNCS